MKFSLFAVKQTFLFVNTKPAYTLLSLCSASESVATCQSYSVAQPHNSPINIMNFILPGVHDIEELMCIVATHLYNIQVQILMCVP